MKRFTCAALAALIAVACSSPESTSIPDPTSGPGEASATDPSNPDDPGATTKPDKPSKPSIPDPPGDPKPDPATKADCDAFASTFCQRLSTCDHFVSKLLGTVATCAARYSAVCAAGAAAPGSGMTHTALGACTPLIASASCGGLVDAVGPAGCSFKGALPDASKCAFAHQCASGSCSARAGQCGACVHVAAIGEGCAGYVECAAGAYCDITNGKCAARVPLGQACAPSSGDHCVENGSCVNGVCTAFAPPGQACDKNGVTSPMCDLQNGFVCIGTPRTCQEVPLTTALGGACGFEQDSLSICGSGLSCDYGSSSSGSGTCIAETPEGGACAADHDGGSSTCALALECIGGKCTYPTAAVCK